MKKRGSVPLVPVLSSGCHSGFWENLQPEEAHLGEKWSGLTSLDWEVRCRHHMGSSAAYYFLMTGADTLSWRLRGLCRAPLTPEPEENQSLPSMAVAGEQAAISFCLPAVH